MAEQNSNLIKSDGEEVFNAALKAFTEALTGIAASDKKDWALSFGYLLQRVRGGKFLKTLSDECAKYRKKGRIKDDYLTSEQGQACLQEILDSLDKESPDEIRFNAMKAVLLAAATETTTNRDSFLPQQFMRVCRTLSSGEIIVLGGSLKVYESNHRFGLEVGTHKECRCWAQHVAAETKLTYADLVLSFERSLAAKGLIAENVGSNDLQFLVTEHLRLTEFGFNLCKFIEKGRTEP